MPQFMPTFTYVVLIFIEFKIKSGHFYLSFDLHYPIYFVFGSILILSFTIYFGL